jgi:hypothetical protein
MAEYASNSSYASTGQFGEFLDVWTPQDFPAQADDSQYTIQSVYEYRPDLLAGDLYGDAGLWWVFAIRNPDALKDPLWDFSTGTTIFLPKKPTLDLYLG